MSERAILARVAGLDRRQTGRTSRMLAEALRLAGAGRAVYVLTDSERTREGMRRRFEAAHGSNTGVKFETVASLGPTFDWQTMRISGAHPRCVVLADHYAIESTFAAMIEMLHRFDVEEQP